MLSSPLYENPGWVPDGGASDVLSKEFQRSTRRVYPQSTVPVEYGDPKTRRYRLPSVMLCYRCKSCCNYVSIYNKALSLIISILLLYVACGHRGHTYGYHSVFFGKPGVTNGIKAVLTVGRSA